jgi:nucleoside 2-deoxyribosyltransferase
MMSRNFCGLEWRTTSFRIEEDNSCILYTNDKIGRIHFTQGSGFSYSLLTESIYYKILSLIHEKTVYDAPYVICFEKQKNQIFQWAIQQKYAFTIVTETEFLSDFPGNILEIQMRALMLLHKKYPKYGQEIPKIVRYEYFAEDTNALTFILDSLKRKNFINIDITRTPSGPIFNLPMTIAENGWIKIEKEQQHDYSKQVFVAMWFNDSMIAVYQAIKKAVSECGFSLVRIDKKEHNNEISGEILHEIKNSHFIVADVTGQRNGVYFEAGFAMGNKKQVIWSCREEDMENVHFDTRQYNHIVWKNEQDLYEKLKDRIMGTVALNNEPNDPYHGVHP